MSTIRQNYIDGHWVAGDTTVTNMNPSDLSDVIGEYARANVAQTEGAVAAARAAFASWGRSTPQERFDLLDRIGTVLLARREELGRLLSREEGKILSEGIGEVTRAGHIFKFFAGETLRMTGENVSSVRPGISVEVTREPLGVVALITPWNFPMAIPAWKIAPALA
jgi:aldehyde dehydrogenase (NAD+)